MAYTVSQNFKTAVKDETVRKSCLILFGDLFFDSSDITEDGAIFSQYFNVTEDLTYGDCPSDTLSFSVLSRGCLSKYNFGKARTYLGVQTNITPFQYGQIGGEDIISYLEVNGNVYCSTFRTLYRNNTVISNIGDNFSIISDGTYVYAVRADYCTIITDATGASTRYEMNPFLVRKLLDEPKCAVFYESGLTAEAWDGEYKYTFEYVPMGVYNVMKPRTAFWDVITIQDAHDDMSKFDKDASACLSQLRYPKTIGDIYKAVCDYAGVQYDASMFDNYVITYNTSPFTDEQCSLRDVLGWIAEKARRVAKFDRTGVLRLLSISTTVQEALDAHDVQQNEYSIATFETAPVTGAIVQLPNGSTLTYVDPANPYVINNNPFITSLSVSAQQAYLAIPTYTPMELRVLEADPSIDVGDFFTVNLSVDEVSLITNGFSETYSTGSGTDIIAYAVTPNLTKSILMHREIQFLGGIMAEYSATGNENREAPSAEGKQSSSNSISSGRVEISNADGDKKLTFLPPPNGEITIQPRIVSTW